MEKVAILIRRDLHDPRIGLITLTEVKLSRDLVDCEIRYSILGSQADRSKCQHALAQSTGYLQREIGKTLRTRLVPKFTFVYDESIEGIFANVFAILC